MSRVQRKRLRVNQVDSDQGVTAWEWYQREAAADVDNWLAQIDAGDVIAEITTDVPEYEIQNIEGEFDFAVVQMDDAGNRSDPSTFPAWMAVSLDLSPPTAATGGVIENVA